MTDYKFVTAEELGEKLIKERYRRGGYEIGFTYDTPLDIDGADWQPTGWFGFQWLPVFGAGELVYGYYGGGIDQIMEAENEITDADIVRFVRKCLFTEDELRSPDEFICVDKADWEA